MKCLLPARGFVYAIPAAGKGGTGLYSLEGFPKASKSSPVLIQGVEINDSDVVLPVATLSGFKLIYSFGSDFGNVTVMGEVLLGANGDTAQALTTVLDWFKARRISKSKEPVNLSLPGGTAYKIYITSMGIGRADIERNCQPFAIGAIIAEPPQ